MKKTKIGFTILDFPIVIVIIAILAANSLVTYAPRLGVVRNIRIYY